MLIVREPHTWAWSLGAPDNLVMGSSSFRTTKEEAAQTVLANITKDDPELLVFL